MAKKAGGSRRENRVQIYLPPDLKKVLDTERLKSRIPATWSTFVVNALAEWAEWRSGEALPEGSGHGQGESLIQDGERRDFIRSRKAGTARERHPR
jgi:hypothetical protein